LQDLLGMNDTFQAKFVKKYFNGFQELKKSFNQFLTFDFIHFHLFTFHLILINMALPQQVVEQLNQGTRRTPGWSSGMLLFSGSVLVVVIVIYAGLQFGYTPYLNGQVSSLESQAQKLGQSVSVTDQANLVTFYSRINHLQSLIQNHIFFSKFLTWFEQHTEANVYYTNMVFASNDQVALVGVVVATTAGAGLNLVAGAPPAAAATSGPGVGTPYVASLGDSYISGEAGRWAGNTNQSSSEIDALGPTAYFDNATGTAEQIPGCHRSKSAEIQIGGGVGSVNLACSGAKTSTFFDSNGNFKPGIDFYSDSSGRQGQALMLQNFAAAHNVRMVMLSIGGNNFNFATVVQTCVEDWLLSPSWWPDYCSSDSSVTITGRSSWQPRARTSSYPCRPCTISGSSGRAFSL